MKLLTKFTQLDPTIKLPRKHELQYFICNLHPFEGYSIYGVDINEVFPNDLVAECVYEEVDSFKHDNIIMYKHKTLHTAHLFGVYNNQKITVADILQFRTMDSHPDLDKIQVLDDFDSNGKPKLVSIEEFFK